MIRYRSDLERKGAEQLSALGLQWDYETEKLEYVQRKRYVPDFIVSGPRGKKVYVEFKGYFRPADRSKLLAVRENNPGVDIRLVFQRASTKISKDSKTTYAQWCEKHGFLYSDAGRVPPEWFQAARRRECRNRSSTPTRSPSACGSVSRRSTGRSSATRPTRRMAA